ncbi:hypothetical protein Cni_G17440 [Canna indica]|uniref:Uncharacterized protein n=1 Tax=Canna indica TaxID=4628 RepID=A0AAQ3KMG9_9LILI|nr:hypothetical protein Cni_G17440 [Canna indica]
MGEDGGSQDASNARKGALGDITNVYGKRSLSLFSVKDVAGQNICRSGEENRGENFERQSTGGTKKMKGKIDDADETLTDSKGKGLFSFDPKLASQAMTSDSIVNFSQRSVLSNIFSQQMNCDPSAPGSTEADRLGQGYVSFRSGSAQCGKSFETDSEEESLDDNETDSCDSIKYSFLNKSFDSKSMASKCSDLDFTAIKEGIDSIEGLSNAPVGKSDGLNCLKPSGSLDINMDDGPNPPTGVPSCGKTSISGNHCQCSFCLKAAYILTDLYYQDARGRLAALKKSKRLAVEARSSSNNFNIRATRNSSKRTAELEFELTQQWRSLFLYTENTLVRETAQLHANFLRLKELKEKCKRELEMASMAPAEK